MSFSRLVWGTYPRWVFSFARMCLRVPPVLGWVKGNPKGQTHVLGDQHAQSVKIWPFRNQAPRRRSPSPLKPCSNLSNLELQQMAKAMTNFSWVKLGNPTKNRQINQQKPHFPNKTAKQSEICLPHPFATVLGGRPSAPRADAPGPILSASPPAGRPAGRRPSAGPRESLRNGRWALKTDHPFYRGL